MVFSQPALTALNLFLHTTLQTAARIKTLCFIMTQFILGGILGSHGDDYEDSIFGDVAPCGQVDTD
jgi:hypothetical protein